MTQTTTTAPILFVILFWVLCGLICASGSYAYDLKRYDLGCGKKSHIEAWAGDLGIGLFGGPISLTVGFFYTGFYQYGFYFPNSEQWPCLEYEENYP